MASAHGEGVRPFNEQLSQALSEYQQKTPITKRTLAGFVSSLSADTPNPDPDQE